jgi:outer membrane lipoprotein carrier protein
MMRWWPWILALTALATPSQPTAGEVVRLLEVRYGSARTLRAVFLERYFEGGRQLRVESGVVFFRRPGKMRWEYESPEKSLFVVDGRTTWFYVPADHTVTRVARKQSTDWRAPFALLAGGFRLSRVCARVEIAESERPASSNGAVLRCQPRVAGSRAPRAAGSGDAVDGVQDEDEVLLEVDRASGELSRVVLREKSDIQVEFRLADWQFDLPLPESLFRFEPPRGVAIVNGETPDNKPGARR